VSATGSAPAKIKVCWTWKLWVRGGRSNGAVGGLSHHRTSISRRSSPGQVAEGDELTGNRARDLHRSHLRERGHRLPVGPHRCQRHLTRVRLGEPVVTGRDGEAGRHLDEDEPWRRSAALAGTATPGSASRRSLFRERPEVAARRVDAGAGPRPVRRPGRHRRVPGRLSCSSSRPTGSGRSAAGRHFVWLAQSVRVGLPLPATDLIG
jgi:hypothetical protein